MQLYTQPHAAIWSHGTLWCWERGELVCSLKNREHEMRGKEAPQKWEEERKHLRNGGERKHLRNGGKMRHLRNGKRKGSTSEMDGKCVSSEVEVKIKLSLELGVKWVTLTHWKWGENELGGFLQIGGRDDEAFSLKPLYILPQWFNGRRCPLVPSDKTFFCLIKQKLWVLLSKNWLLFR